MKLKLPTSIAALVAICSISSAVQADSQSYSYLETQLTQFSHNEAHLDNGLGLAISIPLGKNWYLTGSNAKNDFSSDDATQGEFTNWFLGFGYAWQLSNNNSVYLQLSSETQKLEASLVSLEKRGASIELGNHYHFNSRWSLSSHIRFSDINITEAEDRSNEFYFGARLNYQINDQFSVGVSYENGEIDRSDLALRFSF